MSPARRALHHVALCPTDLEASLRFYRDGLGLVELMDRRFEGDWPTLFGAGATELRSIFLGDPEAPDAGVVELVDLGPLLPTHEPAPAPRHGFFLLSFNVDLAAATERLARLGADVRARIEVHGVAMAVVRDPDGTQVELIDLP